MLWRPSVKTSRSVPYGQATHSETGKNDEESSENDKAGLETGENKKTRFLQGTLRVGCTLGRPARTELFDFLAAKTDHVAAKLQFYVYGYNDANQMRGEYEQII